MERPDLQRMLRAIDPVTGERILVPGDMTHAEWYEKFVKGKEGEIAERNANHLRNLDKEQFEKYKEIFPDEIPDTIEKFRELKYNNPKEWERLKAAKQDKLNSMEFSEMEGLVEKLGNLETRLWYKAHDEKIPSLIDKTKSLREQAEQACELRRIYKKQARDLMKNQEERQKLDVKHPIQTFEELLTHKRQKYGLEGDDAYIDIIRSSTTTNKEYDAKAGVRDENRD